MHRFIIILLFALRVEAAMVRVIAVPDARSITIEHAGAQPTFRLSGVEITDETSAKTLLRRTIVGAWVLLERAPDGGVFVYRSPDALFVNRELVVRGYARATIRELSNDPAPPMTILGVIDPGPRTYSDTQHRSPDRPKSRSRPRSRRSAAPK